MVVGDGIGQYLAYSVVTTTTTASSTTSAAAEYHQHDSTLGGGMENELLDYVVSPLWACDMSRLRMATSQDAQGQGLGLSTGNHTPYQYNYDNTLY